MSRLNKSKETFSWSPPKGFSGKVTLRLVQNMLDFYQKCDFFKNNAVLYRSLQGHRGC